MLSAMYPKRYFDQRYNIYTNPKALAFTARLSQIKFPTNRKRTLVVGCGLGCDLVRPNAIGIDISPHAVNFCRKRGMNAKMMDAHKLGFKNKSFDYILLVHTLEHLEKPDVALEEINRVLKPNGTLYIEIPSTGVDGDREDAEYSTWNSLTITNLLEKKGFRVDYTTAAKNYRGRFLFNKLPFSVAEKACKILGYTDLSLVIKARKSKLPALVEKIHSDLLAFYERENIKPETYYRAKEIAIRLKKGGLKMPKIKNTRTIAVHCFQHAARRVAPIIHELIKSKYEVIVLAHDLKSRDILIKEGIRPRLLDEYLKVNELDDLKSQVWRRIRQAEAFIKKEKPNLILTEIDNFLIPKCLVEVANIKGIPTLLYQHGLDPLADLPYSSKYVAVWGKKFKRELVKAGVKRSKIHITGFVSTDEILSYQWEPKGIVTFTTQSQIFTEDQNREMFEKAVGYAKDMNMTLIFKPHPAVAGRIEKALALKHRHVKVAHPKYPLYKLLAQSDRLLSVSSTTILEGLIMGVEVRDPRDFSIIEFDDIEKYIYKLDKKNAHRVVKVIEGLCARKKKNN